MPVARDYRSGKRADIRGRLTKILSAIIAIASGRQRGSRHGHRHGTSISHRDFNKHGDMAGRRAGLVKPGRISVWRLSILICMVLSSIWVSWHIISQTLAQSLAESHPDVALSWVIDQPTAL